VKFNQRHLWATLLCGLILIGLTFSLTACKAREESQQINIEAEEKDTETDTETDTGTDTEIDAETAIEEVLYKGLLFRDTQIDISEFNLAMDDRPNPHEFISCYPELNYGNELNFITYSENGICTYIEVKYPTNAGIISKQLNTAIEAAVRYIRTQLPENSSEAEKVCVISDYIVTNAEYAFKSDGKTPNENYATAYSILIERKGICNAYADAFNILAREFDLQVITVSGTAQTKSGSFPHAWNLVQVDGDWYHADITWNDPAPDEKGRAKHDYKMSHHKSKD